MGVLPCNLLYVEDVHLKRAAHHLSKQLPTRVQNRENIDVQLDCSYATEWLTFPYDVFQHASQVRHIHIHCPLG